MRDLKNRQYQDLTKGISTGMGGALATGLAGIGINTVGGLGLIHSARNRRQYVDSAELIQKFKDKGLIPKDVVADFTVVHDPIRSHYMPPEGLKIKKRVTELQNTAEKDLTRKQLAFRQKLIKGTGIKGIPSELEYEALKRAYTPGVHVPERAIPFITAHEVGHATGSRIPFKYYKYGPLAGTAAGLGLLGHAAYRAYEGDKDLAWSAYAAPAVGVAGHIPRQAEELRATLRGLKFLNKAGIPVKNRLAKVILQQANYLGGGLAMTAPLVGGAVGLGAYLRAKYKGKK